MLKKNPRINVTVEPAMARTLGKLAKQEHKSVSSMVKELITEALEVREDMILSSLAQNRDLEPRRTVRHEEAWK